jgi:hypothetical protein
VVLKQRFLLYSTGGEPKATLNNATQQLMLSQLRLIPLLANARNFRRHPFTLKCIEY